MRPIDADAAKARLIDAAANVSSKISIEAFYTIVLIANRFDCEDDFPTIEAEPVRHGKWERPTKSKIARYCSLCGTRHVSGSANNFCPKCGAKMEGGEDG